MDSKIKDLKVWLEFYLIFLYSEWESEADKKNREKIAAKIEVLCEVISFMLYGMGKGNETN